MRSIWNGTISFGLVSIPVKLYSATDQRGLDLDMLDSSDLSRIRYKRVNENTGAEVQWQDIVKGYKNEDENYTVLTDEDFQQANAKKTQTIEIETFIDAAEVSEVLYKKPYFLEPQKGGGKAYNLIRDALTKTGKFGVATFILRQKENLCLLGVYQEALVLHVIRFADEIRDPAELNLPAAKVTRKEIDMALSLIETYTEEFDVEKFTDVYTEQLLKIIEAKATGKPAKVQKYEQKATPAKDLMAQLKASLAKRKAKKAS